jgi:protein O-GlcNAc transferase
MSGNTQQLFAEAMRLHRAGDVERAGRLYRDVAGRDPGHARAAFLLGSLELEAGRVAAALPWFQRAAGLDAKQPAFHGFLGDALHQLGRFEGAVESYRRMIALKPDHAEAHLNLGRALEADGQLEQALLAYEMALRLRPDVAGGHFSLGRLAWTLGRTDRALVVLEAGVVRAPADPDLHNLVGLVYKDLARIEPAVASFKRAIELVPRAQEAHSNLVYNLSFDPRQDDLGILHEARRWAVMHRAEVERPRSRTDFSCSRDPLRTLRVAYLGPTLRDHIIGRLLVPVLEQHDRERVEVFCFSDDPSFDEVSARLKAASRHWEQVASLDDAQLARRVQEHRIDVLVDVNMHMAKSRLRVFAERVAPVQMCWLAYPGTTGLSTMDYRISDVHLDPPELDDACYAEQTLRLPDAFWCFDALGVSPEVGPLPAERNGFVTFGCLNNPCKLSVETLVLWARVLTGVVGSRLVVLVHAESTRAWVTSELSARGVAHERVEFVSYQPRANYLETYRRIDVGLDTLPYNGHTTSIDSFYMGVPVVTRRGRTVAGRAGACLAHNLGLSELIADDDDSFVERAQRLAEDRERLRELRTGLRQRLQKSPLMDAPGFARNLEALYRAAWAAWCDGSKESVARSIAVDAVSVREQP